VQGHGNGGNGAGRGRGRGCGDRRSEYADSDDGDEGRDLEQHGDDDNWHQGRHARSQENEERFGKLKFSMPKFGKLKFTMPKFDGGSDPEAYLTWELNVDKIFPMHNYSKEKKMAMRALEFDNYALIWWEQLLSDREDVGHGDVRSWAETKRVMKARFVPKHYCHDLFDKL
jgi:hypothetical protein